MEAVYEITYVGQFIGAYKGKQRTFNWTESKCQKHFGKDEWEEIKQGYAPHIVAVQTN